nr:hypothetical protein [Klebsiella pneumoniae subsp. pneumoniae]
MAIPSTSDAAEGTQSGVSARISVGIQSVIKLFYRPSGLSMPAVKRPKADFQQYGTWTGY